jgi:hypothetical protein
MEVRLMMRPLNTSRTVLWSIVVLVLVGVTAVPATAELSVDDLYRQDASHQFTGPVSFFFVHGYVTSTYQDFEKDFDTTEDGLTGPPGNVTLANSSSATFHQDVALMLGAEINDQIKILTEQHWINDNSPNNDHTNLVFTQAYVEWSPWSDKPYRIRTGRFWSSFAGTSDDLLSAQNEFAPTPMARSVLPFSFQEGVQVDGAYKLSDGDVGLNWTFEVGNGNNAFPENGGSPGVSYDNNSEKDIIARVGVLPLNFMEEHSLSRLELGANYIDGTIQDQPGSTIEYDGWAADLNWEAPKYRLRAYYADIENDTFTAGGGETTLDREGLLIEGRYEVLEDVGVLGSMDVKARYDEFSRETTSRTRGDERISYGINFHPHDQLTLDVEYHESDETDDSTEMEDDGVTAAITASF